jgi:hypothetical protein
MSKFQPFVSKYVTVSGDKENEEVIKVKSGIDIGLSPLSSLLRRDYDTIERSHENIGQKTATCKPGRENFQETNLANTFISYF